MRNPRPPFFLPRPLIIDPIDLIETVQDVIEAAVDTAMDTAFSLQDRTSWRAENLRGEARAFAGRFASHPSWRSAWERTSRGWSDTD